MPLKGTIQHSSLLNVSTFSTNYRYITNNIAYTSLAMLILAFLVSDSLTPSKSPSFEDLSRCVSCRRDNYTWCMSTKHNIVLIQYNSLTIIIYHILYVTDKWVMIYVYTIVRSLLIEHLNITLFDLCWYCYLNLISMS